MRQGLATASVLAVLGLTTVGTASATPGTHPNDDNCRGISASTYRFLTNGPGGSPTNPGQDQSSFVHFLQASGSSFGTFEKGFYSATCPPHGP
jgi:hypothetical protein